VDSIRIENSTKAGKGGYVHKHPVAIVRTSKKDILLCATGGPGTDPHLHPIEFVQDGANWVFGKAGKRPHIHTMSGVEYEPEPKKFKRPADQRDPLVEAQELFKSAISHEASSRYNAFRSERYYRGDQWDYLDEAKMVASDRAALRLNYIEPLMDVLDGYNRRNKVETVLAPIRGEGDQLDADVMGALVKHELERNRFPKTKNVLFSDQLIAGRGNVECRVCYREDARGKVVIEWYPWKEIVYGPHNLLNGHDAKYASKTKFMSLRELTAQWPEKAEEVTADWQERSTYPTPETDANLDYPKYREGNMEMFSFNENSLVDVATKNYKVIEVLQSFERKQWRMTYFGETNPKGISTELIDYPPAIIKSLKEMTGVVMVPFFRKQFEVTIFAGDVVLESYAPNKENYPFDKLNIVPIYAKKRGRHWWGKVYPLLDLQDQINKNESLIVDYAVKGNAKPTFIERDMFWKPSDADRYIKESSMPGTVWIVKSVGRIPIQQETNNIPPDLINWSLMSPQRMREISNITAVMAGQAGERQAGKSLDKQELSGLGGNEFLFDNQNDGNMELVRLVIQAIKQIYTPERAMDVLHGENAKEQIMVSGVQAEGEQDDSKVPLFDGPYTIEQIKAVLERLKTVDFACSVDESPWTPTRREKTMNKMIDISTKTGMAPDPMAMLELADLPTSVKKAWVKRIEQQSAAAGQEAQTKMMMEIIKPIIKPLAEAGILPPAVLEFYGMGGPQGG